VGVTLRPRPQGATGYAAAAHGISALGGAASAYLAALIQRTGAGLQAEAGSEALRAN
jgi:hypothetical protein